MAGYQATIVVEDPAGCPVAQAAERVDATVDSVSRSARRGSETVVEEFTIRDPAGTLEGKLDRNSDDGTASNGGLASTEELASNGELNSNGGTTSNGRETVTDTESDPSVTAADSAGTTDAGETVGTSVPAGRATSEIRPVEIDETIDENTAERRRDGVTLEPVAATEHDRTYRFTRDWTTDCVCEVVEAGGSPVGSLRAVDGALHVTVTASDLETLSRTVTDLKAGFDGVELHEITQATPDDDTDLVLIDRARLTDRQREVIETAHELGYFQYPKGANAGEVADALEISGSTFAEHLAAAQTKLLDAILTN